MKARELFKAGKLNEAIQAVSAELRDRPSDTQARTFLFELLCFAGEYDRAEKHLRILADSSKEAQLGAILYFSALHGERLRLEQFTGDLPVNPPTQEFPGSLNGTPFQSIVDAEPRINARLELFAAGAYLWIPFEHIEAIELEAPRRLRDLLWAPALVRTGPGFEGRELGEVLIPVLYPRSFASGSDAVRLGRETHWQETNGEAIPIGQKMFLVDGEEFPLLEVRKIEFTARNTAAA
jgi:type VI secretion system protein ImpE